MSQIILYGAIGSPPVTSVMLTLHALDLKYEFKAVDVSAGETKTEEFLKKNPQHTVPVLEDKGSCFWDSHAINAYLVRKYGKTDVLYPKDVFERAVVDQRLHFESGVLGARVLRGFVSPHLTKEEKFAGVFEAYDFLEAFLTGTYMAGDHLTIADFSILPTTSTLNVVVPVEATKTPKLFAWLDLMKQLPYYGETNGKCIEMVVERVKQLTTEGKV